MKKVILLIGFWNEGTIMHFREHLLSQNASFDFLDLSFVKFSESMDIRWSDERLHIDFGIQSFDFTNYRAFYSRAFYFDTGDPFRNSSLTRLINTIYHFLMRADPAIRVANRNNYFNSNTNKYIHTHVLAGCGFTVPDTRIIGDPGILHAMIAGRERYINKGVSGMRTIARKLTKQDLARTTTVQEHPVLVQQYIKGDDVRLHLIGNTAIALRISSPVTDYRYNNSGKANTYDDIGVPEEIYQHCLNYSKKENLEFVGFDFKLTAAGNWYALEANPMPGYNYYDRRLHGRISSALHQYLIYET